MQIVEQKERIILGIDPGTAVMGYGLVKETGSKIELISLGVVKMGAIDDHMLKLQRIFEKTVNLIDNYHPDCLAIEAPFYGKNIQVMLKLGRAQGVAMAAALSRNVEITEYSPRKIKQSITGNGNATKEQVAAMLQNLLKFTRNARIFRRNRRTRRSSLPFIPKDQYKSREKAAARNLTQAGKLL